MRTLQDGTEVNELPEPITLEVYTKCPSKWMLIDRETGEHYVGYETEGKNSWKRINETPNN